MLRTFRRFTPLVSFSLLSKQQSEKDVDKLNVVIPSEPKTGWERVKKMYSKDEYEGLSLEIQHVSQSAMTGFFVGAGIGGFVQSRNAYLYFIENNQATIFKSILQAKKKLQDAVTIAFAKGAVRWGWRLGLFSGIFSLTTTTIAVYRGDTSLIEYVTAGAITGALFKLNLGLAATCVGAGLGATLGAVFGSIILILLKTANVTMDDIRKALHKLNEGRTEQFNQMLDKSSETKNDPLAKHHDSLVKEKGEKSIIDIQ